MAHYAFLNSENIVVDVIVGKDENNDVDWEKHYQDVRGLICKRTSYNTQGNAHVLGGTPYRKNYAGIGYTYNETIDGFIPPKPYNSWVLDKNTGLWNAPVPYPNVDYKCVWDENSLNWIKFISENI
jgi:hypothetical protein